MSESLDPIKLGPSGWRARTADADTLASMRRLVPAIGDHLRQTGEAGHGVVVGDDRRFLSEDFAASGTGTHPDRRAASERHLFA